MDIAEWLGFSVHPNLTSLASIPHITFRIPHITDSPVRSIGAVGRFRVRVRLLLGLGLVLYKYVLHI